MENPVNIFIASLIKNDFSFFANVPCSLLNPYLQTLERYKGEIISVSALREDIAIGLAAGSTMSGKKSVVFMQNSGFGLSVNSIASLILPFKIPILLVIGCRGAKESDPEETLIMGKITLKLLKILQIPAKLLDSRNAKKVIVWASEIIESGNCASILIPSKENGFT